LGLSPDFSLQTLHAALDAQLYGEQAAVRLSQKALALRTDKSDIVVQLLRVPWV